MFCNKCGNQIDETAKFCSNCGAKIKTDSKNMNKDIKDNLKEIERVEEIRDHLKPKDGKHHIMMINGFDESYSKESYKKGGYNKATIQIDNVIELIQDEGYEIVDVKITYATYYRIKILIIYK